MTTEHHLVRANALLLVLNVALLIFIAFVPEASRDVWNRLLLTGIFLTSMYVIGSHSPRLIVVVLLLVGLQWLARLIDWQHLAILSWGLNGFYILYLVVRMAIQFADARRVTASTLLIAVNGYLLIGLICALEAMLIARLVPGSFFVVREGVFLNGGGDFHAFVYYVFMNMTTVGFGDIIPVSDAARALAVLLAATGPLYIAIVIAFLVGKYAGGVGTFRQDSAA